MSAKAAARERHLLHPVAECRRVRRGLRRKDVEGFDGWHQDLFTQHFEFGRWGLKKDEIRGAVLLGEAELHGQRHCPGRHIDLVELPVESVDAEAAGGHRDLVDTELWQETRPELLGRDRSRLDSDEGKVVGWRAPRVDATTHVLPLLGHDGGDTEVGILDGPTFDALGSESHRCTEEERDERQA
jgi:hypothetical protein